ncbi:MAG: DUF4197 domain-containing protein [Bacteroidota bacterium]|nr:DUF4197 domain-containing protein [Candidatus Kapabacteria bacterium]MDW8219052.1 DUF4197 domain-containing protein [Bacteroidota bacterium]
MVLIVSTATAQNTRVSSKKQSSAKTAKTSAPTVSSRPSSSASSTSSTVPQVGAGAAQPRSSTSSTSSEQGITPSLAASGLQEALIQGIRKGVELVSKTDGYLGNPLIKIPFPPEFSAVESAVRKIGLGSVADQAVVSMNRAAEQAAGDALPIFLDAIRQLTFTDVMSILTGTNERAATDFLQRTTSDQLIQRFKPSITDALNKVDATRYWGQIVSAYNQIPLVQKVNPDLPDYVTKRAIDGLFTMIAQEEKNIRQNPLARTTDVLQQVFGGIKKTIQR